MTRLEALIAVDQLLEPEAQVRERLGKICRATLESRGISTLHLSNAQCQSEVLCGRHSAVDEAFFACVLLRLLGINPACIHDEGAEFRILVMRLFERMPQVFATLNVDRSLQGFEKFLALEKAGQEAERFLGEALRPLNSLGGFDQVRQRIMRVYSNQLVRALIVPFLPDNLQKDGLREILASVYEHLKADPRDVLHTFEDAKASLTSAIQSCETSPTRYARNFFRPFLEALLREVQVNFQSSPANLAAALILKPIGRKYPFGVVGASVRVGFALENIGAGVALDVHVRIDADEALAVRVTSQFLDEVESGATIEPVEFEVFVKTKITAGVGVLCRLTWTNGDGSQEEREDLFELESQRADIDWNMLAFQEPYSLEPVRRVHELIGRTEQVRQLLAKLRAPSVGSFWIHGQRRVGKTSVVATLVDVPEASSLTILYFETGEFIDPEPKVTIDNLGRKICARLIASDIRFSGMETPSFDGALAPLDDFLAIAFSRVPELRLVLVLDEFDALPAGLYKRGSAAGHAFFMTIRSLSGKEGVGFILVGGEKMQEILSTQGESLNKFRPLRIDYLERESHWADFVDLVRRPVESWATVSDDAVTALYEETAGNPFFTKFICAALASDMIGRRDAFASSTDMRRAVDTAVKEAGINNFQHFWDDGIVASSSERAEQERVTRRRVLVALGKSLREFPFATREVIYEQATSQGVAESETQRVLSDLAKRRILVEQSGRYRFKVRLFESWLVDRGLNELALTLVEEDSLRRHMEAEESLRVKAHEIVKLADSWGNYRGKLVTEERIRAWLDQFNGAEEKRLMFDVLRGVKFYSGGLLREKLREGHGFVLRELAGRGVARVEAPGARKRTDNVLISYFCGEGKRGASYAKLYADENSIYHERVVSPEKLSARLLSLDDVEGIVFVDDFIGTGRTVSTILLPIVNRLVDDLLRNSVDLFLVSVAGFESAQRGVQRKMDALPLRAFVTVLDRLDESDKCFSDNSRVFPDAVQRNRACVIATEYGKKLVKTHPLGHGGSESLVVFEMTCPNNSLPILWAEGMKRDWHPLFPRP